MKEAVESYQNGDMIMYEKVLRHASGFINELMRILDYRYEISFQLMSLYTYVNKCLMTARFQKNPEELTIVNSVISKLLTGFEGICKEDLTGPVMQNTQQLYAGLTYGKGVLNEVSIDQREQNRGFKA
jgi:flagellar protein FliS